mmetsp:Transcript_104703/g.327702  ORF Transcript_104703/g.327702 Transcript_104703/m.327702 type:complete len:311 (-) Transcript_104703:25-957(-)
MSERADVTAEASWPQACRKPWQCPLPSWDSWPRHGSCSSSSSSSNGTAIIISHHVSRVPVWSWFLLALACLLLCVCNTVFCLYWCRHIETGLKNRRTRGGAEVSSEDEDEDGEAASPQSETSETRLRQAVEQPLVLAEALREAAVVAAAALPEGGSAEDLEAELQRFSADTRVQEATAELQAMHEACLHGRGPELSEACAVGPWTPEAALETLRELGRSKAQAVRNLVSAARAAGPDGQEAQCLGAKVVQACARAEEEVWGKLWPGDRSRRCCFLPALDHFEAADRRFCERRASAECELAALAAAAGTGR